MHKLLLICGSLFLLCSCGQNMPSSKSTANAIGLLEVTVSGIGEGATPTATAKWVQGRISGQSATVLPVNGTNALNDVEFKRGMVNFSDDEHTNTRYVYSTFDLINRTGTNFSSLTLYAVNVPTNVGGSALASMVSATAMAITDESVARGFQPTHGMLSGGTSLEVNPRIADLQLISPAEAADVKLQAVNQGILSNTAAVLEYGFVARNLSGGRSIGARNLVNGCTDNACKGYVTLGFKFPRINPRPNNPFSFSLYFVVSNEGNAYVSQGLEEQATSTIAGLTNTSSFTQSRVLSGSNTGNSLEGLNNLCQVKTAVSTVAHPSNILMPATLSTTSGSLDSCFGAGGTKISSLNSSTDRAYALALQNDGKLVVAGYSRNSSKLEFALARYNSNGLLDSTFNGTGKVTTAIGSSDAAASAIALQTDGKIVVAGYSAVNTSNTDFALARYNPDGSLDTAFGTGGKVTTPIGSGDDRANAVAVQSDGKIVLAGYSSNSINDFAVVRYNTNGSLDPTFDTDGKVTTSFGLSDDQANALAIQSDGKIVLAGYSNAGGTADFALTRYNPNGSLDSAFGTGGKVTTPIGAGTEQAYALTIQSDTKIVVAGYSVNGSRVDFALVRYSSNGSLDTGFGGTGKVTTSMGGSSDFVNAMAIQSDGKIVAAGYGFNGSSYDFALARYNPNGSLDTTFDNDGKVTTSFGLSTDVAQAVAIQSDGKLVVAGYSNTVSNGGFALARYNP